MKSKRLLIIGAVGALIALTAIFFATKDKNLPGDLTDVEGENLVNELTIVSWGGAYSKSQLEAYHKPFSEKTGVNIINDASSNEAVSKLRAMNEAGNITWDLIDVTVSDATRLCDEGIAMAIEPNKHLARGDDGSKASKDFGDFIVSDCFIPLIVYSTAFGYRTDVAQWNGREPTKICDIFDVKNFPGKRSFEKKPINNMEWALLCDGVPLEDVYTTLETEEGQQRAFDKLTSVKDHVIWWSTGSDTPQLLADKEIVMGSTYNGRLFDLIEVKKKPVKMLWDAQVFDLDGWVIPTGLPKERLDRILQYVYFSTDTQRLADQAKYIPYGPARKSSIPLVGKHAVLGIDMGPHMPTHPDNAKTAWLRDFAWWADYRDDIDVKFQAWLAQ